MKPTITDDYWYKVIVYYRDANRHYRPCTVHLTAREPMTPVQIRDAAYDRIKATVYSEVWPGDVQVHHVELLQADGQLDMFEPQQLEL